MHLIDVSSLKVVHVQVCPCHHAPVLLICMQAPNTQLSTDLVDFTMMAASGYMNAAKKHAHKRKRKA